MPTASASKEYGYDALGQLTTETTGASTRTYAYDTAGNIRSITKDGTVTKSFGYTNPSWPDLLTSVTANGTTKDVLYEGQSQTSDLPSSGNPVTYYNGKDYTFTWMKGRQLASATVDGKQVSYTYDMSGVRSGKQVGDTTYTYTTLSGKVMRQQWDGKTLEFVYDDGNQPFAMIYKHGSAAELYYYLVNAQGDVAAILDSSGTMVASYNYDAWGSCTVYNSSDAAIGDLNPLRYRGYYYDAETGFYYLQSRYYDPAICRFINADTFATTDANGLLSANMFAYCENNPIMRTDESGEFFNTVIGAVIGATFGAVSAAIAGTSIWGGALSGAVSGAVAGFGVDVAMATVATGPVGIAVAAVATFGGGFIGSIAGDAIEAKANGQSFQLGSADTLGRAVIAGVANVVTGGLNTAVGKATGEVFNKTLSLKRVAKTIWRSTSDLVKRGRGITRAFGVDSTVKMTLLQRMSARIFSGRWWRK